MVLWVVTVPRLTYFWEAHHGRTRPTAFIAPAAFDPALQVVAPPGGSPESAP